MKEVRPTIFMRKKLLFLMSFMIAALAILGFRVFYIQAFQGEVLQIRAYEQHTRDRLIRPDRGNIYDRNGVGL
ncbi:MAG: peptidoglycan glycosyltransferase, partial [Defluviitaleaceae bacterium]|nr:peptidoglycan glycosyltransferase [Defluviitaleaceae bacterium]